MNNFDMRCPACKREMKIREFECPDCSTTVRGYFQSGGSLGLSEEQLNFVKTFLRVRGNIKEVEKELGISYPTVRNRLDAVVRALGLVPLAEETAAEERRNVLDMLEKGEINADAAAKMLKGKRR